jgi:hypothetical protein
MLSGVRLQPFDGRLIARVADEPHPLRERCRSEEIRIGLHGVALRDAAAAHDAERLLVDDVHPLLRDDVLRLAGIRNRAGHGVTERIFPRRSMSTTRSFTIGRFPIAEITGT